MIIDSNLNLLKEELRKVSKKLAILGRENEEDWKTNYSIDLDAELEKNLFNLNQSMILLKKALNADDKITASFAMEKAVQFAKNVATIYENLYWDIIAVRFAEENEDKWPDFPFEEKIPGHYQVDRSCFNIM